MLASSSTGSPHAVAQRSGLDRPLFSDCESRLRAQARRSRRMGKSWCCGAMAGRISKPCKPHGAPRNRPLHYFLSTCLLRGYDLTKIPLLDGRRARTVLPQRPAFPIRYSDHVVGDGAAFFSRPLPVRRGHHLQKVSSLYHNDGLLMGQSEMCDSARIRDCRLYRSWRITDRIWVTDHGIHGKDKQLHYAAESAPDFRRRS